jgi:hypothetical protein
VAVPLAKYESHNLRIYRPCGIRPNDLHQVIDSVLADLGKPYDRRKAARMMPPSRADERPSTAAAYLLGAQGFLVAQGFFGAHGFFGAQGLPAGAPIAVGLTFMIVPLPNT